MTTVDDIETPKSRRVFLWFFLAVQAMFVVWIIADLGGSEPVNCGSLSAADCRTANDVGTGIGVILILGLWFAVNAFLGLAYGIYRLARRRD